MRSPTWFKRTLFSVFAIILIILAVPVAVLNSTWALNAATKRLNTLDNIAITYQEGTLFSTLIFTDIDIVLPGWDISIVKISTGLSLDCVWEQRLCLTSLQVLAPQIVQTPHTALDDTPEQQSSTATLPFPVTVNNLEIANLTLQLQDRTLLKTAVNIAHIGLKAGSASEVLLDIDPLVIDIPSLELMLPIISAASAEPIAVPKPEPEPVSLNALINSLHQRIVALAPQYQDIVLQWQTMMQAPKPWLQAQNPIHIPLNISALTLIMNDITLGNLAGDLQLTDLSLTSLFSLNPKGLTSTIDLTHPNFSLDSQFTITSDWTHHIDTKLQWQAINLAQPQMSLAMQPGSIILNGDISAWQITTQANIQHLAYANYQLSNLNWDFNALGDQEGIIIRPSPINYGPHAIEIKGNVPTTTQATIDLSVGYFSKQPESIAARIQVQDTLLSPTFTGQVSLKDVQQPRIDVHSLIVDFSGDFTSVNAQIEANWTHQEMLDTDTSSAQKALTGQYNQAVAIKFNPENINVNLQTMQVDSPLANVALAPYNIELIPGYLRKSIIANTSVSSAIKEPALIKIDQWQLTLHNATQDNLGTWQIQPINLQIHDTLNDYFNETALPPIAVNISTLNIQSLVDLANPFLANPITITTDANINGEALIGLTGSTAEPQINITGNLGVTPSSWQITPKLDATITQAKVDVSAQYRLSDTTTPLSVNSTGILTGEQLGDIQYQFVMADKLTLYTQIKSINLGLVAPFLPQFTRFSGNTSANIALTKEGQQLSLNGIIIIPELDVAIEQLDKSAITPHGDIIITHPVEQGFSNPNAAFTEAPLDLQANIRVLVDPLQKNKVKVAGFDFSTNLQGSVEFYLERQQPSVIGTIALNNGQYQAYGQDLLIRSGQLIFNGPASLPFIQLEAIRNPKNMNDDVIAGLKISGLANQLDAQLFSEPMLENPNILSYLIRGKDLNDDTQEDNSVLLTNAILGFGLGKSQEAISEFGDKIGVQNLQLSTQGQGDNAQLGITGQLNERLSVEYRVGVFNAIAEFGLRYQWLPNLYVEATSGAENALDVFYQLSWGNRALPASLPGSEKPITQ